MSQTKITVKLNNGLLANFEKQLQVLPIKRDAFLNGIIRVETTRLAEQMESRRLSVSARRYIAGALKSMGTTTVNIVVDQSTADALNEVVERTNLVRDAFCNRLIMFLRSSEGLLKYLNIPQFENSYELVDDVETSTTWSSPMWRIEEVFSDPLRFLHSAAKSVHECGLYLVPLPTKFAGFSCYLDESEVPGTSAYKRAQEELAAFYEALEIDEFVSTTSNEKVPL